MTPCAKPSLAHRLLLLGALSALMLSGCQDTARRATERRPYFGPTQTMQQVVEEINANNHALPTLWATHYFDAWIVDPENGRTHFVNGEGVLLMRKPMEMRLLASKPGMDIFEIGSTEERYWLKIQPEMDTMWWGHYRNLGRPCSQPIPIRPDLVMEVLGISNVDTNLLQLPAPVMRFNPDADAYMFVWQVPHGDRWIATKEIWYDRKTKLPTLVLLFDEDGRVVLRAYLANHQPLDAGGAEDAPRPRMARDLRLFFPDTGTRMHFQLDEVRLQNRNVPREGSIRFPTRPGVGKVIQLDEACDP